MEHFINNYFVVMVFGGAQVALAVWTCTLFILVTYKKKQTWAYDAAESTLIAVTCLVIGAATTLFNVARGHFLEAAALLTITLFWNLVNNERSR
ncbi:MAG: hypothetical protein Q8O19_02045 [Rectinemataceae bacterium]|nr:hypothetical protein [Rectinemataceae bacterium]